MAISLQKLCVVIISLFVLFFPCPVLSISLSNRCPSHESDALLRFKAPLKILDSAISLWINGTDCCTWQGISCDNQTNHVVSVLAGGVQVEGMISESLCQLHFLTSLTMQFVLGTPTLPPCLGNLTYMKSFDITYSGFSGMIPSFLCLFTRLTYLRLSHNMLNGSIPSCLSNLSSLTNLDLSNNQLSGSIPASLGNLSSLSSLELSWNQLSGSIPDSLGSLSSLSDLDLRDNQLSGTIPPSFAQLSFLTGFYGDGNRFNETIFSSSFPASLISLRLSLNQSIIETFFHNLTNLMFLYLSNCVLNISKTWNPSF